MDASGHLDRASRGVAENVLGHPRFLADAREALGAVDNPSRGLLYLAGPVALEYPFGHAEDDSQLVADVVAQHAMEDLEMLPGLLFLRHIGVYRQSVAAAALVLEREAAIGEPLDPICRLPPDEFRCHVAVCDLLVEPCRLLRAFRRDDVIVQRLPDDILGPVAERLLERRVDALDDGPGLRQLVDDGSVVQQFDEVPQLYQL